MYTAPALIDDVMLRTAVMSSSMAMAVTDPHQPDNPIVFTNPAFSTLTGYDAGSIVGRNCRFLQGPDTDPAAVAAIRKALAARTDLQVDIMNYRKDGTSFTNRLFISPVHDADGRLIHFFASQLDATELLRADAVKRRREDVLRYLTGELTQRLNATLRVVQTLVSNTLASASSVIEASEAISARLVALGQVHRQIAANDWDDEDFEGLLNQTIGPFRPQFAEVAIVGPRLRLGALRSLQMASAIHELSLNAAIRRIGEARRVRVEWSIQDAPDGCRLLFTWHEQGTTRLSHAERTALHRAMTKIMNDPDADVSVRVDHERGGLICRIDAALGPPRVGPFMRTAAGL